MASELLLVLFTFEDSTKCFRISFDSDSFLEEIKGPDPCSWTKVFQFLEEKDDEF